MTSGKGQRDLDETDIYDAGMFPAPPAQRLPPQPASPYDIPAPPAGTVMTGAHRPAPADHYRLPDTRAASQWPPGWQPPHDTSALAVLSATLLLVLGIVGAIAFAFTLAVWDALARASIGFGALPLQAIEGMRVMIIALLLLSLLQVVSAIGVFAHRGWGRLLGIAISVPGLFAGTLLAAAAITRELELQTWLAGLLLVVYGLIFFGLIAGSSHFRRMAPRG